MSTVLLVEDSEMFHELIKRVFASDKLEWARTGKEAIEIYKKSKPDIVLMDVILPDMNGIEAIKKIKSIDKNAKIIVLTGIDYDEVREDAIRAGAVDYISKNAGVSYLKQRVYEEISEYQKSSAGHGPMQSRQ